MSNKSNPTIYVPPKTTPVTYTVKDKHGKDVSTDPTKEDKK